MQIAEYDQISKNMEIPLVLINNAIVGGAFNFPFLKKQSLF